MYVFKPTRPGRAAAASGYALAPAPLRERAGRLARDTGAWLWVCRGCVREREVFCGAAPQRQARYASQSVRPADAVALGHGSTESSHRLLGIAASPRTAGGIRTRASSGHRAKR
jgi:hypothetical protein